MPSAGYEEPLGVTAVHWFAGRERDREWLRGHECRAGVRAERDGGTVGVIGVSDAMAARSGPTDRIDAERSGWSHHQQHGDRAHERYRNQRLCQRAQHHALDSRHVRLFRAVVHFGCVKTFR